MEKVFFIGINGIGMSALAKIMVERGYSVYGSDIEIKEITYELERMGVQIYIGHKDINVKGMDMVVYSSAIKFDNPEMVFAKLNNIQIVKRGEILAKLMNTVKGIAIAGTHGKTTTSSMSALVLDKLDPTVMVGGIVPELGSNSKLGKSDFFVAEADESDNSFLYINPYYSIITNVEPDHMEFHLTFENLRNSFKKFIQQTQEKAIVCIDSPELLSIANEFPREKIITYSIYDKTADIFAKNIRQEKNRTVYEVDIYGKTVGEFELRILGLHNVSNSLGPIFLATHYGINSIDIKNILLKFKGAKRRFDILYDKDITIIDDYAHHPTEIAATLKAARQRTQNRVIAVFQPHRYSRTKLLLDDFRESFFEADKVMIMPIYAAGEKNIYEISEEILAKTLNKNGDVTVLKEKEMIINKVIAEKQDGDIVVFMGAGDIYKVSKKMSDVMNG